MTARSRPRLLPRRLRRATLTLNSGTYYFDSLQLESQSNLHLQQDAGPVVVNATTVLQLRGQLAAVGGDHPDLLLVELGSSDVFVETPFDGAIVAPNASVTLRSVTPGHTGFFYGRNVTVDPRTNISPRPALPLLVAGGVDIADCARAIPLRADLTGRAQEIAYQEDVTRYCSMQGENGCIASLYGLANADQYAAAAQLATQVSTPSTYLAISRDRRRKLFGAENNVATAVDLCTGHDADGDWVPDSVDQCPNTPDLTPTDDHGRPLPASAYPAAPSATDVASVLSTMGVVYSPNCKNAPLPDATGGAAPIVARYWAWHGAPGMHREHCAARQHRFFPVCKPAHQRIRSLSDGERPDGLLRDEDRPERSALPWR